jgi:DNA polymerase-3 subunit delta'
MVVQTTATGVIGIEAIRELQSAASLQPFEARGKVLILDNADAMTRDAANALLKLLEEPPPGVTLLLTTANEEVVPDTIRSRCQTLRLRPLPFARVEEALRERGVEAEEAARLAHISGGRLEAALALTEDPSYLDTRREALAQLIEALAMPPADRLRLAGRMADGFFRDRERLYAQLDLWATLLRDALLISAGAPEGVTDPTLVEELAALARPTAETAQALQAVQFTHESLRRNANPRLAVEALLLALPFIPSPPGRGPG